MLRRFQVGTDLTPEAIRAGFATTVVDARHPSNGRPLSIAWCQNRGEAERIADGMERYLDA